MNASAILKDTQHREWPLPRSPWIMTQVWHELLFAHWPIAPELLRPLIPALLPLDTYEGEAWVGVVPFRMSHVSPRGLPPVRGLSAFPELNVRTYVTVNGIPGVYFFSLDASNPIAVALARSLFHLPYYNARMHCQRIDETIHYTSMRTHRGAPMAELVANYRPVEPVSYAEHGSLPFWLTERYALYTIVGARLYRGDIHHEQWPLQRAEWEVTRDTMARSHAIALPDTAPLLHYSHRQEVLIWPLQRLR